jgi:hypothetical protein
MENLRELIYTSCVPVEPESEDGPLIFTRAQRDACIEARAGLEQGEGESDETIAGILQGLLGESGEPKPSGAV